MNFRWIHMHILVLSFFLLAAGVSSCSYKHYKGFEQFTGTNTDSPSVFDTAFERVVYQTVFRVLGRKLSGLTIIKKTLADSTIHVVFMSQIGLKFFDVEIRQGNKDWFHIQYVMASLNKDFIINTLKTDFMLLFAQYPEYAETTSFRRFGDGATETTIRYERYVSSVFTAPEKNITGIELRKGRSLKTSIRFSSGGTSPEFIGIDNKKAGLQLEWTKIHR